MKNTQLRNYSAYAVLVILLTVVMGTVVGLTASNASTPTASVEISY